MRLVPAVDVESGLRARRHDVSLSFVLHCRAPHGLYFGIADRGFANRTLVRLRGVSALLADLALFGGGALARRERPVEYHLAARVALGRCKFSHRCTRRLLSQRS